MWRPRLHTVENIRKVFSTALPAVVQLQGRTKSAKESFQGTAWFAGPRTLLTAAHVIDDAAPNSLKMVSDFYKRVERLTVVSVNQAADLAVLRLRRRSSRWPEHIQVMEDGFLGLANGHPLLVIGYHGRFVGPVVGELGWVDNAPWSGIEGGILKPPPSRQRMLFFQNMNLSNGHSGAPVICRLTGQAISVAKGQSLDGGIAANIASGPMLGDVRDILRSSGGIR